MLTADKLRRNRRLGIVLCFVVAVALPGIDPVTTTLQALPLLVLFEGSIWLAAFFEKRWALRPKRAEAELAGYDRFVTQVYAADWVLPVDGAGPIETAASRSRTTGGSSPVGPADELERASERISRAA